MSEHFSEAPMDQGDDARELVLPDQDVAATGHDGVDRVVASLQRLDDRPVSEHVAVFEAAHDTLRGALADAGSDPAGA